MSLSKIFITFWIVINLYLSRRLNKKTNISEIFSAKICDGRKKFADYNVPDGICRILPGKTEVRGAYTNYQSQLMHGECGKRYVEFYDSNTQQFEYEKRNIILCTLGVGVYRCLSAGSNDQTIVNYMYEARNGLQACVMTGNEISLNGAEYFG